MALSPDLGYDNGLLMLRPEHASSQHELGYLPGDYEAKLSPWLEPFFQAIRSLSITNDHDFMEELKATDRDGAIAELVRALQAAGKISKGNCKKIIEAVIARENEASTGMGKGVAIPHVKHKAVADVVATVGQSSVGIDFAALDKQPVYSVILLISPADQPDKHLEAMEKVFRHLQQDRFRKFLSQCQNAHQIEDLLREADDNPSL